MRDYRGVALDLGMAGIAALPFAGWAIWNWPCEDGILGWLGWPAIVAFAACFGLARAIGRLFQGWPGLDDPNPRSPAGAAPNRPLTPAELAALGSSNREIARKLHVTVSTVEQHLTRIYRKLHIKRRSELPRRLTRNRFAQETGRFPEAVS